MSFNATATFWSNTAFEHWEKTPFVLRASEGAPSIPLERVWPLVVQASESRRGGNRKVPSVSFWLDRAEPIEIEDFLPRHDHAMIESYLLGERVRGREFTLLINAAQVLSWEFFHDLRAFVEPLVAKAGVAVTETAIYLTRARRTVFGVHCDESSNFLFVVYGKKCFRLWPREVLDTHPQFKNAVEYDEIAGLSTFVELAAGDLLYMPSGCYHIAEADGEVGLHASIIVNVDPGMARKMVVHAATGVIAERLRGVESAAFLPSEDGRGPVRLPPVLVAGSAAVTGGLAAGVERALIEQWAKFASAGGFANVPPAAAEEPLSDSDAVRIVAGRPILFDARDNELLLVSHGHALRAPAHPLIARLIERLNAGDPWPVGTLIAEHTGNAVVDGVEFEAGAEGLKALLQSLVAIGALSIAR